MSDDKELNFADYVALFRIGPERMTMRKADAIRLAEAAQVASDELKRLRDRIAELEAENAALRNNKTEEEALRKMMRDPRYWRQRDPELDNKVRDGFRKLVGGGER